MKRITKGFYGLLSIWVLFLALLSGCGAKTPETTTTPVDTAAPASPSVSINSGASSTLSNAVTLALSATDDVGVTGYYASETSTTPSASASGWTSLTSATSYSASVSFTLSSGDAAKTVYVWFKDAAGNVSASVSDTITLAAKLVGTWGEVTLDHNNGGTWNTEVCKFTYNSDNTGTSTCQWNNGGTLGTGAPNTFTYTVVSNSDGSLTITKTFASDGSIKTHRWVIGDDGKVMILDGTTNTNKQRLRVAVRLDTAKTYTNADLIGDYYFGRYGFNSSPYAIAGITTFDGIGARSSTVETNASGTIGTSTSTGTYSVSSDGVYTIDSTYTGYMMGNGRFGVNTEVNNSSAWSCGLSLKKADKIYSTADLAGTWAYITFGDNGGTSFRAVIGTETCTSSGSCSYSEKHQQDGSVSYTSGTNTFSVASDGRITDANNLSKNSAIGNNGNTIIVNNSFDTSNPGKRRIAIKVKCSTCGDLAGAPISGVGAKFPIATTAAYELGFSAAFDGTNWLVGFGTDVDGTPGGGNSADAQFISQSGTKAGSLIQGGGKGGSGFVAYGGGGYLLLGGDAGGLNPPVGGDLWGKTVSTSGTLGSKFLIGSGSGLINSNFEGVAYGGGSFFVVYGGEDTLGNMKVYGKIVSPSGTVGSDIAISSGYGGGGYNNVAFDGTNFLVAWRDDSNDYEVKGRFISPAGTLGTEFSINASTYPSDNPLTVSFDWTNYLVVWTDEVCTPAGTHCGEWDVFGQRVDKSGNKVGGVINISTAGGQQFFPQIAFDGTNYLVTWTDMRNDANKNWTCDAGEGTCLDIYGQYISTSGSLVGSEFIINNDAGGQFGGVAGFNSGKYLVIVNDGATMYPLGCTSGCEFATTDVYGVFVTP